MAASQEPAVLPSLPSRDHKSKDQINPQNTPSSSVPAVLSNMEGKLRPAPPPSAFPQPQPLSTDFMVCPQEKRFLRSKILGDTVLSKISKNTYSSRTFLEVLPWRCASQLSKTRHRIQCLRPSTTAEVFSTEAHLPRMHLR